MVGQGKCGVAVVRISGSKASEAILKMTNCKELPKPRVAKLNYIKDPETLEELDKGLILWFPGKIKKHYIQTATQKKKKSLT